MSLSYSLLHTPHLATPTAISTGWLQYQLHWCLPWYPQTSLTETFESGPSAIHRTSTESDLRYPVRYGFYLSPLHHLQVIHILATDARLFRCRYLATRGLAAASLLQIACYRGGFTPQVGSRALFGTLACFVFSLFFRCFSRGYGSCSW